MQIKSFTTWINLHLTKVGMEVTDMKTDFSDGLRLIRLVLPRSLLPPPLPPPPPPLR